MSAKQPKSVQTIMTEEDDIYIDCKPVDINNEEITNSSYLGDNLNKKFNDKILDDLTDNNFNIFDNIGFQSLLAVGIFAIILLSGNYVFNVIPNSRLKKAIDGDRFN